MAFADEIIKRQGQRRVYLDFSQVSNPGIDWEGEVTRLFGKTPDNMGTVPIKGTVVSFGTFARSVLNLELDLETPSITIELKDQYNEWRALGEPPSNRLLYRWVHLLIRVIDDNGLLYDQRVATGQIVDPQFPPGQTVRLTVQLTPGAFLGEKLPRRLITLRDFPRCQPENVGKAVPVIYGVMSNSVRTAVVEEDPSPPGAVSYVSQSMGAAYRVHLAWVGAGAATATGIYQVLLFTISSSLATITVRVNLGASSSSQYLLRGWYDAGSGYVSIGTTTVTTLTATQLPAMSDRSSLPWDQLSIHIRTSTRSAVGNFAADGVIEIQRNGEVFASVSGITLPVDPNTASRSMQWTLGGAMDLDDVWHATDFQGTVRAFSDGFDWLDRGAWADNGAGGFSTANFTARGYAGNHAIYVNTDGGFTGASYASALQNPPVLPITYGTFLSLASAAPTFIEPRLLSCTPTDTGTGPNMAAGAVRALLVDTGLTTSVSVSQPAPTPGALTIDHSIEQMGTAFANERIGAGHINVPTFFYVAPMVGGNVGPLSSIMDLDQGYDPDYPTHDAVISWNDITTTPDQWIVWMTTDPNFHPVSNPEPGARVRIIDGTPYTDPDWPPGNTYDYQVVFTSVDDGDAWEPVPTLPGATTAFSGYRYLLAGHTLKRVNEVYVRRPVSVPAEAPASPDEHQADDPHVEDDEQEMVTQEMQVLQQEGTDYVQEVIEINGNRYHTLRFFGAQQSDDCTQQYEVTANVEGAEANADGTGELITEALPMVEHILLNWVFNNYRSSIGAYAPPGGRWFTDVPYSPGLLDHTSFLSAYEAAFSFVTGGYLGAGMLTEQVDGAQLVADLIRSFGLDFYFDPLGAAGNGAWFVKLFLPDAVSRASLTELHPNPPADAGYAGIAAGTFAWKFERGWHQTAVEYFAGPMVGRTADASTNESGGYTVSGSITDPNGVELYGLITGKPLYLLWTRDPATAYSVAYRKLQLSVYPPIVAECEVTPGVILTPLAFEVKVTHPDGSGLNGWTQRVCRIYRADFNYDTMMVRVQLRDVDAVVP